MEFRFRAGDRGPSSSSATGGGSPPAPPSHPTPSDDDYFGGPAGLFPPPLDWEAARREEIIQMEVRQRLCEEEVRREFDAQGDLAFGHHGGFGGPTVFFMPPPMPMPFPMHAPPPPMLFQGFNQSGPRPHPGFGENMPLRRGWRGWSPPRPKTKTKQKLQLLEIEPSGASEAPSSKTNVQSMKRKADTIVGPTVPQKIQKLTKDWSCALCQVSAPGEAGLNKHLEGRKHKAKLAQCGGSKVITDDKDNLGKITGIKNGVDPCDAPLKVCILVDGEMHEVVQKNEYLWCDCCKVRCDNNITMAGHLRSKKHSKKNKVWKSIEAVRMNTKTNEDLFSPCESKVNTNDSTGIPAVIKGDIDMAIKVGERRSIENPVEIKNERTSMASEVESTNTDTEVHENSPMETPSETNKEGMDMKNDVGKHKAKLAQCGASKVITDDKDNLGKITGIKNGIDPCDAPLKVCILVDGDMHEVVQKNKYLWCDCCKVRGDNNITMAGHLRSKKHSKKNKVWKSIEAVRMNTKTNEDLSSPCESKVNTNDSTGIPAVIKGDIDMAIKVGERRSVENPVEIKNERTSMASEVESTNTDTEIHENSPVETPSETNKEGMDMKK